MKIQYALIIVLLISAFAGKNVFATDDFQARPPVFVPGSVEKSDDESGEKKCIKEDLRLQTKIGEEDVDVPFDAFVLRAPSLYYSFGAQSETTWFDRRLNWSGFSTQLVLDTGCSGIRYQGSMSGVDRDTFQLFDSRVDIYTYWYPDDEEFSEYGYVRFGGGVSYFDCDPHRGQEFLKGQHWALFFNSYMGIFEFKFVALLKDSAWNGGLMEFKIFNPFLYLGTHTPEDAPDGYWLLGAINFVIPVEVGFTTAFGLPEGNDGWGWYIKGRYAFLQSAFVQDGKHLSSGFEFYWQYKSGIGNDRVSEGWECGIKYTVVGF